MPVWLTFNDARGYWLTRLILERGIGVISLVAFIVALNQFKPLLGERGLLPVRLFVQRVPFGDAPSLFHFIPKDAAFTVAAWAGIVLSCLVVTGISSRYTWLSVAVWLLIYLLYLSFVNVGQTFYGFGWESILLEACFFCMFLGGSHTVPQFIPNFLFRWLLFRIMFGAGLIKLRGDPCWRNLTCLDYFYETQPMPNPVSWYAHWAPHWVNRGGVAFNHFAELIVPFAFFMPQPIASIAGIISILFQLSIIVTGNLSWLNWMTLILAFSTIDDRFFRHVLPAHPPGLVSPAVPVAISQVALALLVAIMSYPVVTNMISPGQIMNTNFNSLHLVGTYGAFGSITKMRYEVVIEGTQDAVITPATQWREYEFKAKPGDVNSMPPQIAPYHLRIDWLMWFAAMSSYRDYPWFVNLVAKLLEGDKPVLSLLRKNPFPDRPPHFLRAQLYEYHFTTPDERARTHAWWTRTIAGSYFPAISLDNPQLQNLLRIEGWTQ